jgi:hypothetical protein
MTINRMALSIMTFMRMERSTMTFIILEGQCKKNKNKIGNTHNNETQQNDT